MSNKQITLYQNDVYIDTSLDPTIFGDGKLYVNGTTTLNNTLYASGIDMGDSTITDLSSFSLKGSTSGVITFLPQAIAGTYNFNMPTTAGTAGQILTSAGGGGNVMTWTNPAGGSVSSVSATVPSFLSISGSPITSSGTLAISYSGTALPVLNGGTGSTTSTGSGSVVLATSPTLVTPVLGAATGTSLQLSGLTASSALATDASKNLVSVANVGTGNNVLQTSPTLITPVLGVATGTSLQLSGLTASSALATDASKNLVSVTNVGTGNNVLQTSPTLVTPVLGVASGTSLALSADLTLAGSTSGIISVKTQAVAGTYNYNLPTTAGSSGQVLTSAGGGVSAMTWTTLTTGTVTSVAATVPSFLSITGSPITSSGTLAISYSGTALPVLNGGTGSTTSTGSGSVVLATSPTLVTPILGAATGTSLQLNGLTASSALATDASKNLVSVTNIGTGNNVLQTSPTLITPVLGVASGTSLALSADLTLAGSTSGIVSIKTQAVAGTYNYNLPITAGSSGQVLTSAGGGASAMTWTTLTTGTVTSVAASVPSFLSITGSPITSSGTLAISYSGTALPVLNGGTGSTTSTGSGSVVLATSPTLVTPVLGAATGTSLQLSGLTASFAVATDASKNLVSVATTGTGNYVLSASPTLTGTITAAAITASGLVTANAGITVSGGNIAMGNNKITGLGYPTLSTDAASKLYVDTIAQGLDAKDSVRAATTVNGTLATAYANGQVIDGVTLVTGNRILIKNQTSSIENGIYIVAASGAPTRSSDFTTGYTPTGAYTFVEEGTVNISAGFVSTAPSGTNVVGTDPMPFTQFSGAGQIIAGTGLTKTGNTLSVNASQIQITTVGTLGALTVTGSINNTALTASQAVATDSSKNLVSVATTGSGNYVLQTSPTLITPVIGIATGISLQLSGLTASSSLATDASKNLVSVTNVGTGNNVLQTSPTLITPVLGVASGTSLALSADLTLAGSTSGVVSIKTQAVAGTYNYNLPTTAGSSGQVLTSAGGGASAMTWTTLTTGTVTSVAASVPSFLSISGSPITSSGTLAISYSGTALPVLNGGTGSTTSTGSGSVVLATSPTLVTPVLGAATGTSLQLSGLTASSALATDASKNLVSVANVGTGNNVLQTSPTLVTPVLGVATGTSLALSADLTLAGSTSGIISIKTQAVAGTYNFNLPITSGSSGQVLTSGGGGVNVMTWANVSHSSLSNLSADDHTQYALLAGRSGGQILTSGTASGNSLTLRSTTDVTKGSVLLDETTVSTSSISGCLRLAGGLGISNTTDAVSSINGGSLTTAGGVAIAKQLFVGTTVTSGTITITNSTQNILNINCQGSTVNPGRIIFTNSGGTGDFSIGADGGDIFWQGGGGRSLQMGAYHEIRLIGGRGTSTIPTFSAGSNTTYNTIVQNLSDSIAFRIQGNSTQTQNLTQWVNNAGTVLSSVDSTGNFTLPICNITNYIQLAGVSAPANPGGGQYRYYTDTSDGLLKSKSSSGTLTIYQPCNTKGDLQSHNGTTNVRVPVSIDGSILVADSTTSSGLAWNSNSYAIIRDEKTVGTNAGTFTSGSWVTRTLNTSVFYPSGQTDISLASNIISLDTGTYHIYAVCPGNRCSRHTSRIVNNDTNAVLIVGTVVDSTTSQDLTTLSIASGILTVSGTLNIRIEHRCTTTRATNGLGIASGFQTEVYTIVDIKKV